MQSNTSMRHGSPKNKGQEGQDGTKATLTPNESTLITGFGIQSTYSMLRRGELPNIKVGKRFFIPRSALLKWLEGCGQISA